MLQFQLDCVKPYLTVSANSPNHYLAANDEFGISCNNDDDHLHNPIRIDDCFFVQSPPTTTPNYQFMQT